MSADCFLIDQFRQNLIGQLLAQFHAPLVKAENVPDYPLDKDLVFVHGDETTQDPGRQHPEENRGGGPIAGKDPMPPVLVDIFRAVAGRL